MDCTLCGLAMHLCLWSGSSLVQLMACDLFWGQAITWTNAEHIVDQALKANFSEIKSQLFFWENFNHVTKALIVEWRSTVFTLTCTVGHFCSTYFFKKLFAIWKQRVLPTGNCEWFFCVNYKQAYLEDWNVFLCVFFPLVVNIFKHGSLSSGFSLVVTTIIYHQFPPGYFWAEVLWRIIHCKKTGVEKQKNILKYKIYIFEAYTCTYIQVPFHIYKYISQKMLHLFAPRWKRWKTFEL